MKAPNIRIYDLLEMGDGLADSNGQFLQVCDGETLWEYEVVLDQPFYRKLSIKPILERLNSPDLDPEIRSKATTQMGVAGPGNAADRPAQNHPVRPEGSGRS